MTGSSPAVPSPEPPSYANPAGVGVPFSSYSHVSRTGGLVFVAGQVGIDAANRPVGPDVAAQTVRAYENVRTILESQGSSLRRVVRFVSYLVAADDVPEFYRAREAYFADAYPDGRFPPNTLLIVAGLVRPELRIEIDATASVSP
jgi:enamine deaminase RidA (YjgF/YER057c/UK114 family)